MFNFSDTKPNLGKSTITDKSSIAMKSDMSVFESRGVAGEQNEVMRRNQEILTRLRERLEETTHKDIDIQKLIEKLPK
jgi:hypothetical protein